jgi:hypothetical protein
MKILGTPIRDRKIGCQNHLIEMTIGEYYAISQNILQNNEYQRRRVKSSSTVYSLLKEDLKQGCIMPAIVLALTQDLQQEEDVIEVINNNKDRIIILDGLQRSYTIRDLVKDVSGSLIDDEKNVLNFPLRVELYTGINKFGILYRMLTYNTGQTQMSTRHQIEIIYSDYIDREQNGIKFIREIDDASPRKIGEYKFRDVVDGFSSYLERDYLSLERIDILNSIKSLQELTKEDPNAELFDVFIHCYNSLVSKIEVQGNNWSPDAENLSLERIFAPSIISTFNKSQSLTGFGAAMGKLIDLGVYENLECAKNKLEEVDLTNVEDGMDLFVIKMDVVRKNAKKIGNDQRLFFYHFYRGLLSVDADSFMNIKGAVEYAARQYEREAM